MINILLDSYNISLPMFYDEFKKYIKPHFSVAVVAFSFRDSQVKNISDWDNLYGKTSGRYYDAIVKPFSAYGISDENISFINYFTDTKASAAKKISEADIIYFPGGLPDRMMDRINEFDLNNILINYDGIIMGYSAGAVIQLAEYHLSPDDDYPEFAYFKGLPYIDDFYVEVHYEGSRIQDDSIKRVISEKGKTVYGTVTDSGALIVDGNNIITLGDVRIFD